MSDAASRGLVSRAYDGYEPAQDKVERKLGELIEATSKTARATARTALEALEAERCDPIGELARLAMNPKTSARLKVELLKELLPYQHSKQAQKIEQQSTILVGLSNTQRAAGVAALIERARARAAGSDAAGGTVDAASGTADAGSE